MLLQNQRDQQARDALAEQRLQQQTLENERQLKALQAQAYARRENDEEERLNKLDDDWLAYKDRMNEKADEEHYYHSSRYDNGGFVEYPVYLGRGGRGTSNAYGAGGADSWADKYGDSKPIPRRYLSVAR